MSSLALEPVIRTLVEDGVFGSVTFLGLEEDDTGIGLQFGSQLAFVKLAVEGSTGKEVFPLVVKTTIAYDDETQTPHLAAMFQNEVTMYKEILPVLGVRDNIYPRYLYGLATNGAQPEEDLLILENLKYKNFFPSKKKIFLDIDHISVAVKKIAEFHSFSFILKHEDKETFLEMTRKLKNTDMGPELMKECEIIGAACLKRGIKPLLKDNIGTDLLNECLDLFKYPVATRDLVRFPEEPFAVICHGDYCNNNIIYKFDENGKAIDGIIFDFQFAMYASPAVDLFFLMYVNTTMELREEHWDNILKLYWDTLRDCVPQHIFLPSFEDFLKHLAERAVYGYSIAAFFLPIMMDNISSKENESSNDKEPPNQNKSSNEKESPKQNESPNENKKPPETIEEKIAKMTSNGGEEAERRLSEIVLHLLNKGYIRAFIQLHKSKLK